MANESSSIVQNYGIIVMSYGTTCKLWGLCRAVDISFILKMADEQTKPPFNKPSTIPKSMIGKAFKKKMATIGGPL